MSDNADQGSPSKVVFTDREEAVLKAAWHCLKTSPEIDMNKLMEQADFNTMKTAVNTWGVIKRKLNQNAGTKTPVGGHPTTPKKAQPVKKPSSSVRKRAQATKAEGGDDDEAPVRPMKKLNTVDKKKVKNEDEDESD